jgi:hypothetical protein
MVAPSFEVTQKVLQLVVQRIVVEDHRITIEHVVPSGPLRLQPEHHAPAGGCILGAVLPEDAMKQPFPGMKHTNPIGWDPSNVTVTIVRGINA